MGRGVAVWMGCAILLCGVITGAARADQELSDSQLRIEMARNDTMAGYVARNGMPDVAERQALTDRPPWDDQEVALYYLDARREIRFARAWILGRPEIHLVRSERPLSDEQVAALATRARRRQRPGAGAMGPTERAEAAAERAESAAARVEQAAEAAERAAEKAESVVAKMETVGHRPGRR